MPIRVPTNEEHRLEVLRQYRIFDTGPESQFDSLVELAKVQFGVPFAVVAFMDSTRNVFKACGDLPVKEIPREESFCMYTILGDKLLVVEDAAIDRRFAGSPVVADMGIRFYAGVPFIHQGAAIGTFCILDKQPRSLTAREKTILTGLAGIVSEHLELRLAAGHVHDEIDTSRRAEAETRVLALHDALTGLPNRYALNEFIDRLGPPSNRVRHAFYADLDDFKIVNHSLGHHRADLVLTQTAEAIRAAFGQYAFVSRISGDEFVAIIDGLTSAEVERRAASIIGELSIPRMIDGRQFSWSMSIGLAAASTNQVDIRRLLERADLALLAAKRADGVRGPVWFDRRMAEAAERRRRLAEDLPQALAANAIGVVYQTIHEAADKPPIGVEALARWSHPSYGDISPEEFVPIAEETGQIDKLGRYVARKALADARRWPDLFVAVNISPLQFRQGQFAEQIQFWLRETSIEPDRLQIEITEGVLLHNTDLVHRQISRLKALGIRIALDDFGTGYASLVSLAQFQFDKLKIDRRFVAGLLTSPVNAAIVNNTIHLARQLNMRVTAEGVETEEQELILRAAGCNSFQGYRYGKAKPASEISAQLAPVPVGLAAAS